MKRLLVIMILIILSTPCLFSHEETILGDMDGMAFDISEKKYKFEDNDLYIYDKHDKRGDVVLITADHELYINHERISVNKRTSKLLKIYHDDVLSLREEAIAIGLEGAKIGLSGAKLGLTAVISLPLLIFGDDEEFETRMEKAGEELERKGEELEKQGEKLEKKADELEDLEDELRERVKELDDLFWF